LAAVDRVAVRQRRVSLFIETFQGICCDLLSGVKRKWAFAAQARDQGSGLIVMPDPFNGANREQITSLAARYRVPAIYYRHEFAEAGGLIAYASDFAEQFPQAAAYVDRILKGAKPADLPVQAPTKFDLIINLTTAKALGLEVPFGMQQRADALIE
jgi:ABC-type uncharacterized transport system substrate-binding protein